MKNLKIFGGTQLSKVTNDIKIAEKLKFWEEQDAINKELIPRIIRNHEMLTDLTYQFEKSLGAITSLQGELEKLSQTYHIDINHLRQQWEYSVSKIDRSEKDIDSINELCFKIQVEQEQTNAQLKLITKKFNLESANNKFGTGNIVNDKSNNDGNKNIPLYVCVFIAIILSIISIVI